MTETKDQIEEIGTIGKLVESSSQDDEEETTTRQVHEENQAYLPAGVDFKNLRVIYLPIQEIL